MIDHVPMKFKYEPCCGTQRTPDSTSAFVGGHKIRMISCIDCSRELRLPWSVPEYKFCTIWNTIANKEEA